MFDSLRRHYGSAAFVLPLCAIMGIIFHMDAMETLYAAVVLYVTVLALMVLDDVFVVEFPNDGTLLSEEELVELDKLVSPAPTVQIKVEMQYH